MDIINKTMEMAVWVLWSSLVGVASIFGILITWKYFLHLIILFLLLFLLKWICEEYERWSHGWLSALINESEIKSKKANKNKLFSFKLNRNSIKMIPNKTKLFLLESYQNSAIYLKNKAFEDFKNPYQPSPTSFFLILSFVAMLFFFGHVNVPYSNIVSLNKWLLFFNKSINSQKSSNFITVFAGLVSIVFALIIFIAESIRDGKNPEQKRVLLKISGLWILAIFTTLSLLNFLWFKLVILSVIFPILIAVGVIYSFWRVINHLIDPEAREENQLKFVKDRMKKIISNSIRERIGNNILFGKIGEDKEIKLEYTFSKSWLHEGASEYIFFESNCEGWLSDINLFELGKLFNKLENSAQQLGFSLYLKSYPVLEKGGVVTDPQTTKYKNEVLKKAYLLKRYGEYLPPTSIFTDGGNAILALPKEFKKNPSLIKYVEDSIPHIFRFKKSEPASEIFRRELRGTKDQLVFAIRSNSLGSIEELKQTYLNLAESFLETLHEFGGGFSSEQAKKERGNFFEGWNEIRWLNQDIRELINVAVTTDNQEVISSILFLPISIAIRAMQANDHLLFQESVDFSPYTYYLTKNKVSDELKPFLIEKSWIYLKELSNLYIEPKLEDRHETRDLKKIREYKNFAIYIFKDFQSILKASFDRKEIETFKTVLVEFLRLYKHFKPENDHPSAESLKISLQWASSEEQKRDILEKMNFQKERENISKKIRLARNQVLFGLSGKILDGFSQAKNDELAKNFFEFSIKNLPNEMLYLTRVFNSVRNFKTEGYWGWDDWEMIADGEVHSINVDHKLDRLYCVRSLQILGKKSLKEIEKIKLPPSRELAYLIGDNPSDGSLTSILDEIISKPAEWKYVLSENEISKAVNLKDILKNAKKAQEQLENEYVKNAILDSDKIIEFKKKLLTEFAKSGHIRAIAKKFRIYKDQTSQILKKKIPSWGYNQIDSKAAFIKDWHVHYSGWGDQYGRGMAESEDLIVFKEMVNGAANYKKVFKQDAIQEIEKIISTGKFKNPIIFQTLDYRFEYEQIKKSELFVSNFSNECPKMELDGFNGYMGVLKFKEINIPIVDLFIHDKELKNKIIIADFEKFGCWRQYSPIDDQKEAKHQEGIFSLNIIDINLEEKMRNEIIAKNPAWLQRQTDKDGDLRKRVIIKLYQKFKFEILDSNAGYCLDIVDEAKYMQITNLTSVISKIQKLRMSEKLNEPTD